MKLYRWLLAGLLGLGLLSGCGGSSGSGEAYECANLGEPKQGAACPQEGLRVCVETAQCTCSNYTCTKGVWHWGEAHDVSCEDLDYPTCACKTYTLDGDWERCSV